MSQCRGPRNLNFPSRPFHNQPLPTMIVHSGKSPQSSQPQGQKEDTIVENHYQNVPSQPVSINVERKAYPQYIPEQYSFNYNKPCIVCNKLYILKMFKIM